jgi:hypothetical protein
LSLQKQTFEKKIWKFKFRQIKSYLKKKINEGK